MAIHSLSPDICSFPCKANHSGAKTSHPECWGLSPFPAKISALVPRGKVDKQRLKIFFPRKKNDMKHSSPCTHVFNRLFSFYFVFPFSYLALVSCGNLSKHKLENVRVSALGDEFKELEGMFVTV